MYQAGELIFYGNTGVCRVEAVTSRKSSGANEEKLYYKLSPLYQTCVIYAPVEAGKVFMRPLISREEALALIKTIPEIQVEVCCAGTAKHAAQRYEQSICTHSCADLIALTMSIYAKKQTAQKQKRKFASVDERFMKRAEELLFGELAAVFEISMEEVPAYIEHQLKRREQSGEQVREAF